MSDKIIAIDIRQFVQNDKWWEYNESPVFHYSKHTHFMSPYESDNDCGTCDGARCDSCMKVYDESIQLAIPSNELENILKTKFTGIPDDVISFFAYDDSGKSLYNGYRLLWPSWTHMKIDFPEFCEEYEKQHGKV